MMCRNQEETTDTLFAYLHENNGAEVHAFQHTVENTCST